MRGLAGRRQGLFKCVVLLTLSEIHKGVRKYFHDVGGNYLDLQLPAKCVPEGCSTLVPLPACYIRGYESHKQWRGIVLSKISF